MKLDMEGHFANLDPNYFKKDSTLFIIQNLMILDLMKSLRKN